MARLYWHGRLKIVSLLSALANSSRRTHGDTDWPAREIETRLRLMKPVRGKLPRAIMAAAAARAKAGAVWEMANAAQVKAGAAWDKAIADNLPAIEALHRAECPNCPWDGKSIFPNTEG